MTNRLLGIVAQFLCGQAAAKDKVDNDCAKLSVPILNHLLKVLGWSHVRTLDHWRKELRDLVRQFEYVAKVKIKEDAVYVNLFLEYNAESYYDDLVDELTEVPSRSYAEIAPLLPGIYRRISKDITSRLNQKRNGGRFTYADVDRWLGILPEIED